MAIDALPLAAEPADDHGWTGYIADSYDRLDAGEIDAEYERMVAPFLDAPPGRILDVGTGPGHFLVAMHRKLPGAELRGIDRDPRHLALARRDLDRHGVPARLERANAERIPYLDGYFDLVICQAVLPYARSDRGFLQEVTRVLRPGGVLWFATSGLGFYVVRIIDRATYWKLRNAASVVSGVVAMATGFKLLQDTPVTTAWLARTLASVGYDVKATEQSRFGRLPKLIRMSAVKRRLSV
jgi:ubiquinone/menaquinone biosynthesis C-methylase UbiE